MKLIKMIVLTVIGGLIYLLMEMLFRGHTHWTMLIDGGICGYLVGELDEIIPWKMSFVMQCILGGILITGVEFISGYIVNICLGWNVWDYSNRPFNLMGQICLEFTCLWIIVCAVWLPVYDYIKYALFNEEKPYYSILGGKR